MNYCDAQQSDGRLKGRPHSRHDSTVGLCYNTVQVSTPTLRALRREHKASNYILTMRNTRAWRHCPYLGSFYIPWVHWKGAYFYRVRPKIRACTASRSRTRKQSHTDNKPSIQSVQLALARARSAFAMSAARYVEMHVPRPAAVHLHAAWLHDVRYEQEEEPPCCCCSCCNDCCGCCRPEPRLVHRQMPVPTFHVEQPVYYGVEVERRVEVTKFIEVEVPVPVDIPVYRDLPQETEVARIGGGWALVDGQNKLNEGLLHGSSWRQPTRRKPPTEFARVKLQQYDGSKYSRPPPSPLARNATTLPRSHLHSRWDAPKFMSAADLDLLKAATARAEQRFIESEKSLNTANLAMERAHRAMGDLAMREHDRESNRTEKAPVAQIKLRRALDEAWSQCERQLHLAAALVTQRQGRVDRARSAMHEAQYAVACARKEMAARARHSNSLEALKKRHANELASLLEKTPQPSKWRQPRSGSAMIRRLQPRPA